MQAVPLAPADLLASGSCLSDEEVVARVRAGDARQQLQRQIDQALGTALQETFSFGFERCDRLVAAVLRRLPSPDASDANKHRERKQQEILQEWMDHYAAWVKQHV